jgi:hypothetical protein
MELSSGVSPTDTGGARVNDGSNTRPSLQAFAIAWLERERHMDEQRAAQDRLLGLEPEAVAELVDLGSSYKAILLDGTEVELVLGGERCHGCGRARQWVECRRIRRVSAGS